MNNSEHDVSSQSLGSPNQSSSMMFNMPQQGQMAFNNRGGGFYPMQGNMMQNMGSNMTPMNFDWMQGGMGGGMNTGMSANMSNYNNQMFPPMNPNMNSNDFMNVMMNNMYRNQGGQNQNMMNPALMQQMNNPNQMMGQQFHQNMPTQKSFDGSGGLKIDDVLSNNMNTLNQFYSMINSQNRDLMSSMNMPFGSNPYNQMSSQKNFDYQNDGMQLPNKTEFMQPMGFPYGAYPNDMSSMPTMPNVGSKGYLNTSNNENLATDYSTAPENKAEERNKSKPAPNTRGASKVINDNPEEVPIQNKNPEDEPVGAKKAAFDWEDRPIKPAKNGFDWEEKPINASKNNQNWEDKPVKSKAPPKKKPQPKPREEVEEAEDDNYQERSNIPEYKNPYDEVQIGGQSGKRFEDILEEQLRANPDAVGKSPKKKGSNSNRQFLKKGSRPHLSSAAQREPKILDESSQKHNMDSHNDSGVMTFSNATTKPPSKGPKGLQNKQQRKSLKEKGEAESSFPGGNAAAPEKVSEKPKEPKKFLARGGGTGGGIGNVSTSTTDRARKSIKEDPQDRHEEERSKSSHARGRTDAKKSEDYNEKPLKANKTQGKFGGAKPELSHNHEDSYNDAQSFEKEYGFEKYMKKSPRAQGKNLSAKRKESPKYNFDDDSASNREEEENAPQVNNFEDEAPVSNLVNKYFYKKKPITGKEKEEEEPEKNEEEDETQKSANEKIETLNSEIARFKLENERVKKIRQKHDEMLKALNKDMADWHKQKEKEQREFEEWKQEEVRKIKNEKKLAERHQKTVSNMPSRKEREEIDNLKKQISKLAEELQTKDKRSKLNMDRLKRQIEEAEQRNSELMDELRTLGKLNPKLAAQGAKNKPSHAFEDEEEQYDDHENNGEVEDQDHEDENEDVERGREASDEENGSDNENLNYEDIVNQPGGKNTGLNRGNYDTGSHSPKFVNEKNMNLTTLSKPGQNETVKSKAAGHHHRTSSTKMGAIDEDNRPLANLQNQNRFSSQDYRFDSNPYFKKYVTNRNEVSKIVNQTVAGDGKIQRIYADGKKEVIFHNGVKREIFPDGYTIVHFINNDIKQTLPDNTVIYFFADAQTTQTTLPNGRHVYRFANNQVELHNPDGSKDIYFADQTRKTIFPNGDEETVFTDGTVQRVNAQKIKTITYASGQKDVVYPDGTKVRTYPDGRVRKHYPDGSTEDF